MDHTHYCSKTSFIQVIKIGTLINSSCQLSVVLVATMLPILFWMEEKQDCLLQGQAQLDQGVVFRFCTLRFRGWGGCQLTKIKNHGLKMHFESFQAILDNVVFYPYTSPLILPEFGVGGGGGVVITWQKWKPWLKNPFYVILSHSIKCCYFTPPPLPARGTGG